MGAYDRIFHEDHFADRKIMIFLQIHVRSFYVLCGELVLQFSTDLAGNLFPDEVGGPLSCKEIPEHFFSHFGLLQVPTLPAVNLGFY